MANDKIVNDKICGLSVEEIENLKAKHGCLILATVKQADQKYHAIFKEPNFVTLESARTIGQTDEIKAAKTLYNNCIIVADLAIENRDYLRLKAVESVGKHMQSFSVDVKNL
ncbi:hypothetical protein [Tenacibaculum piscium]|uniref:hypothetical protein n=1 Tax=Tenacibaculum piscium TaxID=1458515 RepID=UPI001F191CD4|nr:hypothetical protein [Tenacibaculum piscium]